jgi:hypothetical protein
MESFCYELKVWLKVERLCVHKLLQNARLKSPPKKETKSSVFMKDEGRLLVRSKGGLISETYSFSKKKYVKSLSIS